MKDRYNGGKLAGNARARETGLAGRDPYPGELATDVQCAADTDVTVLITGSPSTTARVARWIHRNSARREGPLVVVDCARTNGPSLGASGLRPADGGSAADPLGQLCGGILVLQEVAAMAPEALTRLLREVDAGRSSAVGEGRSKRPGVRIIATTSTDLTPDVSSADFPEECFYRLNAMHLIVTTDETIPDEAPRRNGNRHAPATCRRSPG